MLSLKKTKLEHWATFSLEKSHSRCRTRKTCSLQHGKTHTESFNYHLVWNLGMVLKILADTGKTSLSKAACLLRLTAILFWNGEASLPRSEQEGQDLMLCLRGVLLGRGASEHLQHRFIYKILVFQVPLLSVSWKLNIYRCTQVFGNLLLFCIMQWSKWHLSYQHWGENHLQNVSFTSLFRDLLAHSSLQPGFTFIGSEQVFPLFLFCTPSFSTLPSCVDVIDYLSGKMKAGRAPGKWCFWVGVADSLFFLRGRTQSDVS